MNTALAIIALAGIVVITVISFSSLPNEHKSFKKFQIPALILLVALLIFSQSFKIIPTGYTGVRTTFGQIDPQTAQSGFNWKIPFVQSIEKVNNKQQDIKIMDGKKDGWVWSETAQRTAIHYEDITVTYRINNEMSAWIFANVADYKKSLINDSIVASAIKSGSKGLSDTEATNRSIIEPLAAEFLQKSLDDKYGKDVVIITKVIIGNADFEDSYNNAISEKQQAQIAAEKQAIENERAVNKAQADATVAKTQAEAQANVELIRAEATAEANRMLQASLSDKILSEMWIEKWDGKMPVYIAGENSSTMIGIGAPDFSE